MFTKRLLMAFVICALSCTFAAAQDSADTMDVVKEFTLSAELDGMILNFVVLNDKTVDALFSGSGKYAIRARARASTMFFVQGVPEKDIDFNPDFEVRQDGKTIEGKPVNIKNLEAGPVAKGTRIEGLLQLSEKINLEKPFQIVDSQNAAAEFQLSPEAIKLMQN